MSRPLTSNMSTSTGVLRENGLQVEWQIEDFLSLPRTPVDNFYDSPTFRFLDSVWHLRIYPYGGEENDKIGLYLRKKDSLAVIVTYSLSVKKVDDSLVSKQVYTWKFDRRNSYGSPRILGRSELLKWKSNFLSSEALTVVCILKRPTAPQDQNTICAGLKDILASKELCDVTIHLGKQVFDAHKVILAASSPVFAAMFRNEMSENNSGTVNITDCDPESFQNFLSYLYTGKADITGGNVFDLYETAHKYRVEELMSYCVAFMMQNASVGNICDLAAVGDRYSDHNLNNFCIAFFEDHIRRIVSTAKWKKFLKENELVANRLLKSVTQK